MEATMRERVSRALACSVEMQQATVHGNLLVVRGGSAELDQLMAIWKSASLSRLPELRGLTLSNSSEGKMVLRAWLVSSEDGEPVCLELNFDGNHPLPDFAAVWPHASWWQNELVVFAGGKFPKNSEGGVEWRIP